MNEVRECLHCGTEFERFEQRGEAPVTYKGEYCQGCDDYEWKRDLP